MFQWGAVLAGIVQGSYGTHLLDHLPKQKPISKKQAGYQKCGKEL